MNNNQLDHILTRFLNGVYLNKDIQDLKNALKTEEGYNEVSEIMDNVWKETSTITPNQASFDIYKLEAKKILNNQNSPYGKKVFNLKTLQILKYASVIAIIVLGSFGVEKIYNKIEQTNISYITVTATDKERKEIILPDSSVVLLNARSSLRYPGKFIAENRIVEMKGEAFFQVRKDKAHPFIVHTDRGDVKVLGTSFDIKSYKDDKLFSVSVRTGKVEVYMEESLMRLVPDECLIYNRETGDIIKRRDNVEKVISWTQGGLYFNDTPIQSIALELERIYGCKIELDSNSIFNETLFGEHDNQSLEAVLKSIEYSTGIKNKKENGIIILYKNSINHP